MVARATTSTLTVWRNDLAAGAIAAIVSLPVCVAVGLLAFAPLGPGYAVMGATAGLCGTIVSCCLSAVFATSSFVVTTSRVSEALLLASMTTALLAIPAVAGDRDLIVVAMFLCVLLAGLWQMIFGLAGVAKIIKFTPHPVLVGFLNGVSVLVALSQLKPYFQIDPTTSHLAVFEQPLMFALLVGTAALMLGFPAAARRLPASWSPTTLPPVIVAFAGGLVGFYLLRAINPSFNLGPTVGDLRMTFLSPVARLSSFEAWRHVIQIGVVDRDDVGGTGDHSDARFPDGVSGRAKRRPISPFRRCATWSRKASAIVLRVSRAALPARLRQARAWRPIAPAAGRAWCRCRAAYCCLPTSVLAPQAVAAIPSIVLAGILLATGVLLFDRSVFGIVGEIRQRGLANGPSPLALRFGRDRHRDVHHRLLLGGRRGGHGGRAGRHDLHHQHEPPGDRAYVARP